MMVMGSFDCNVEETEVLLADFDVAIFEGEIALTVKIGGSLQERLAARRLLREHDFFECARVPERPLRSVSNTESYLGYLKAKTAGLL